MTLVRYFPGLKTTFSNTIIFYRMVHHSGRFVAVDHDDDATTDVIVSDAQRPLGTLSRPRMWRESDERGDTGGQGHG